MIKVVSSVDKLVSDIPFVDLKKDVMVDVSNIFEEADLEECLVILETLISDDDVLFKTWDDQTVKDSVLRNLFFVLGVYDSWSIDPEVINKTPRLYGYIPRSSVIKDIKTVDFDKEVKNGLYRDHTFELGNISVVDIYGKTSYDEDTEVHSFSDLVVREEMFYRDKANGDPIDRLKVWTYFNEDGSINCQKYKGKPYLNTMAEVAGQKRRQNIINYIMAGAKERKIEAGFKAIFSQVSDLEYQWKVTGDIAFVDYVENFNFDLVFGEEFGSTLKYLTLEQLKFGKMEE